MELSEQKLKNIIKDVIQDYILQEVRYIDNSYTNKKNWEDAYNHDKITNNETIRVFHGCDNIEDALIFALYGVSGKSKVNRKYSYENGMNTNGLFVTTDFHIAKNNFSRGGVIIEFSAHVSDLDTPVWNKQNTYFGVNSNPLPFKDREEREQQKLRYQNDVSQSEYEYVRKSDNPALANMLFNNHEHQALFVGDLNPNMIKRFWVRNNNDGWIKMSRNNFIKHFKDTKISNDVMQEHDMPLHKLYKPNEDIISYNELVHRLLNYNTKRFPRIKQTKEKIENNLSRHLDKNNPNIYFIKSILYPKQIIQLFGLEWFRKYINPLSSI